MLASVWKIERVQELPADFLADLSDIGRDDLKRWSVLVPDMLALSPEKYCVRFCGRPLLVAGAMRLSLLDPSRELWLYTGRGLQPVHMRRLRRVFRNWTAMQQGPLYARTDSSTKARFLRFLGFRLIATEEAIEIYEALPCRQ